MARKRRHATDPGMLSTFLILSVAAAALATFFRIQLLDDFRFVFGDRADGLIEITLLEHWWNVVRGLSPARTAFFFYPVVDSLGYNDGYLIYGLIYSVFRAVSIDPLMASDLTDLVVKAVGFTGMYLFVRIVLPADRGSATVGALVFTLANSTFVNVGHAQLLSVSFVPVFGLLVAKTFAAISRAEPKAVLAWVACTALFYDAWLLTAFYMAWFTAFFSLFAVLLAALQTRAKEVHRLVSQLRSVCLPLLIGTLIGVVGCVPFLAVYLPTARETGMHALGVVEGFQPSLLDLVDVGPGNVLYGRIDRWLAAMPGGDFASPERVMGLTPGLLLLSAMGAFARGGDEVRTRRMLRVVALAALVTWTLTVRARSFDVWPFFYGFVPGAKAVRVISRYEMFILAPVIVLATSGLTALRRTMSRRSRELGALATLAIGGFLAAEQLNDAPVAGLARLDEMQRLHDVPRPPPGCRAFYAVRTRPGPILFSATTDRSYSHNVDAMFIAEHLHLPTVNGMGSFIPPGWNLLGSNEPDYTTRVLRYAASRKIPASDLCALDLRDERWLPRSP